MSTETLNPKEKAIHKGLENAVKSAIMDFNGSLENPHVDLPPGLINAALVGIVAETVAAQVATHHFAVNKTDLKSFRGRFWFTYAGFRAMAWMAQCMGWAQYYQLRGIFLAIRKNPDGFISMLERSKKHVLAQNAKAQKLQSHLH